MLRKELELWIAERLGRAECSSAPGGSAGLRERIEARRASAEGTHKAGRKSIARSITAENYNGVESLGETRRSTALRSAKPTGLDNLIDPTAPYPKRFFGGW
jgi:hypothetical protein